MRKVVSEMRINELKFGIYLSYISLFVTNVTNLMLTPFIIRNLGQSQYGIYSLIGALVGYLSVLDFGLSNTTVRFVAKYRAENDKKGEENFLASTLIIYVLISITVLLLGSIIYFNLDTIFKSSMNESEIRIAKIMYIILVINLGLSLPINLFKGIISGYERFVFSRVITILQIIIRAAVIFILLSLGYKAIAIVLVDAILNIILMILNMIYVFTKLRVRFKLHQFSLSFLKEIFSYSSLIFISVIVDQFYWRIGHLVLGIIASTSEVAIFSVGMTIGQYYISFSTAISGVFLPRITKMVVKNASGEELTDQLIKIGRIQFIILGLILSGFTLFGNEFISLWAGKDYSESWVIALLVMIPLFVVLTQTIGISILQAKNMHGFRAFVYLGISIINLFVSVLLAKKFGAVGSAAGTTLSLIIGNIIIMNLYYHYKVKLNMKRFFKEVFGGLMGPLLASLFIGSFLLLVPGISWISLFIKCILYSILFFILNWKLGMNNFEKKLLSDTFSKLFTRLQSNNVKFE